MTRWSGHRGGGTLRTPQGHALEVVAEGARVRWQGALVLRATWDGARPRGLALRVPHPPERVHVPHLAPERGLVAGDFVLRCPVVLLVLPGEVVCFALDPDDLARLGDGPAPRAFVDWDHPARTLRVGFGHVTPEGHTFFRLQEGPVPSPRRALALRVHVLASRRPADRENPWGLAARFTWRRWGRRGLDEALAATPLDAYLDHTTRWAFSDDGWGREVWQEPEGLARGAAVRPGAPVFIVDVGRHPSVPPAARTWREPRAIWNQAWFSTQRCANGLLRHAKRRGDATLAQRARAMTEIALAAPDEDGLFPSVLRAEPDGTWRWTNSDRRPDTVSPRAIHLVDAACTARALLAWHALTGDARAWSRALAAGRRIAALQRESGAFPGWLEPDGRVAPELAEGPESAVSASLLFELARHPEGDPTLARAAERAAAFLCGVVDDARWEDFETYWSCAPWGADTQRGRRVARSGVYKQNTLSMFWCAEAMLQAGDAARARRCLDELSLYQAVWDPPFLATRARGGFGVMNADCEWNDARQSLFAPLYFELAERTGDEELRERGAAALRASFSMMYCPENAALAGAYERAFPFFGPESRGFMMENQGHGGRLSIGTFTIFSWGNGSALAAVAELDDRFPEAMRAAFGPRRGGG